MNRIELGYYVAETLGVPVQEGHDAVTAVLDGVLYGLDRDGRVVISAFGSWSYAVTPEHMGHNPQTMEPVKIPARERIRFTVPDRVRDELKKGVRPISSRKLPKGALVAKGTS